MVHRVQGFARLFEQANHLHTDERTNHRPSAWPPGHYYSTIPATEDIDRLHSGLTDADPYSLPGIDLNLTGQQELLGKLGKYYVDQPFSEFAEPGSQRYFYGNQWFVYADGFFLHAMMRHFRPRKIVEVGSGFSSAMMLDTAEMFLDNIAKMTFIEPFPEERLIALIERRKIDLPYRLLKSRLQDVVERPWAELEANDILFVDSSHVSKCGSDVNRLFFEMLPEIAPGVIVHIHDVFAFFEYPREWANWGWFWNESYLLRSFLAFNSDFEILLWPNVLLPLHSDLQQTMPLCFKNTGSSFWMRRKPL